MYQNNSYDHLYSVKALKEQIPSLAETCKQCAAFYLPARNKSIPKYDVILGKQHEEALMHFLEEKLGTAVVRADLENRSYPDCKVLRDDGSVAAYFELKFHGAPFISALSLTGRYCYEGSATLDHKKIEKQLQLMEEGMDAPVFYVHWLEYPCLKGIFFETSQQVKAYLASQHAVFSRAKREGDLQKSKQAVYLKKMYSPLLSMGSFESFLETLKQCIQSKEA